MSMTDIIYRMPSTMRQLDRDLPTASLPMTTTLVRLADSTRSLLVTTLTSYLPPETTSSMAANWVGGMSSVLSHLSIPGEQED